MSETNWSISDSNVSFPAYDRLRLFLFSRMACSMAKTLCELKKLLKADFKTYKQFVCNSSHVCAKCGRTANDKKLLCKPERLK